MDVTIPKIAKLDQLLKSTIDARSKLINYKINLLHATPENYGSLLITIDVFVENDDKTKDSFNVVCKLCPPNEWLQRMFASNITFKKEIEFYKMLVPTLVKFQKENQVSDDQVLSHIFPKCLGARLNLSGGNAADTHAILMLENLKISGYKLLNRLNSFNLEETELVLRDLAKFHGVPLAYKIRHSEKFDKEIRPLLNRIFIGEEMFDIALDKMIESIARYLDLSGDKAERFDKAMKKGIKFQKEFTVVDDLYATIVHTDFWLNNTMIKYKDNKPIKNKMLDFQVCAYNSLACDVTFFLFTSVQQEIIDKYYEHFLTIYYQALINCLKQLNCDVTKFTFESFENEINTYAALEAHQILHMHRPIFKEVTDYKMEEMSIDDMLTDHGMGDVYKTRLRHTAQTFFDRNWI